MRQRWENCFELLIIVMIEKIYRGHRQNLGFLVTAVQRCFLNLYLQLYGVLVDHSRPYKSSKDSCVIFRTLWYILEIQIMHLYTHEMDEKYEGAMYMYALEDR